MSDEVVNKDGTLVVDMAQADALWNSLDPIKRAELTNMMFAPVLAKAKQQANRIEELEAKLAKAVAIAEDAIGTMESDLFFPAEEARRLRNALAELTGGKDE